MIVTLQLSPGTVLSEQALAVRLKIGRNPDPESPAAARERRPGRDHAQAWHHGLRDQFETAAAAARGAARAGAPDGEPGASAPRRRNGREFAEVAEAMLTAAAKADDIAFMRLDQRFNILIATAARTNSPGDRWA